MKNRLDKIDIKIDGNLSAIENWKNIESNLLPDGSGFNQRLMMKHSYLLGILAALTCTKLNSSTDVTQTLLDASTGILDINDTFDAAETLFEYIRIDLAFNGPDKALEHLITAIKSDNQLAKIISVDDIVDLKEDFIRFTKQFTEKI